MDKNGKLLLPEWTADIKPFDNNLAMIATQTLDNQHLKMGYINSKGKWIIEPIYDYEPNILYRKVGKYFKLSKNMQWGIIDDNNKIIVPFEYQDIDLPYFLQSSLLFGIQDRLAVCKNGKWGYLNSKKKLIINFQYQQAQTFVNGFARVKLQDKYGYINWKGVQFWSD